MEPETIDLNKGLSVEQLDHLIGDRDHLPFLNTRNELYRQMDLKHHPPTRADALRLMSQHPNLIRRPILIDGQRILLGFDAEQWKSLSDD
jgi:arsenate reductase-like glutaredoxin family protein